RDARMVARLRILPMSDPSFSPRKLPFPAVAERDRRESMLFLRMAPNKVIPKRLAQRFRVGQSVGDCEAALTNPLAALVVVARRRRARSRADLAGRSAHDLAGILTTRGSHCLGDEQRAVLSLDRVANLGEARQLDVLVGLPAWPLDRDDEPIHLARVT